MGFGTIASAILDSAPLSIKERIINKKKDFKLGKMK